MENNRLGFTILTDSMVQEANGPQVRKQTGTNTETIKRVIWDVQEFMGQSAQIIILDGSDKGWGLINANDFRCREAGG